MKIGIPKEIKNHEYRVGATPNDILSFVKLGHEVKVETKAGESIGFRDEDYAKNGAEIVASAKEIYTSEMIIKVKEPQDSEFSLLQEGQVIFGYFHLAPDPHQTKHLIEKKIVAIAYETVTDVQGRLPLLVPMSEIAGRVSIQAGATALQMAYGGCGVLLGGVPGVRPAKVVVIGGGVAGTEAARMAMGLGADVAILERNLNRLRELDALFGPRLKTLYSDPPTIEEEVASADLVIGSVLIPGKKAPKLISKELVGKMKKGSVIVDIAIDQGGCCETSRPTTHSEPTYNVDGVVHYCVTNMPGACALSSTYALTHATLPFSLEIANKGYKAALSQNPHLMNGLNLWMGQVTNLPVAQDLNYEYRDPAGIF